MRPKDAAEFSRVVQELHEFSRRYDTPGMEDLAAVDSLAAQIIESQHRIDFVTALENRPISPERTNPNSEIYDPVRAAVYLRQHGEIEEAAWQVFLSTHFGHHLKDKWRLAKDVFSGLGDRTWDWQSVSSDITAFRQWLQSAGATLRGGDGVTRRFGNHRKYISLDAWNDNATGHAVASYVKWVSGNGGHGNLFNSALTLTNGDGEQAFAHLYSSMGEVASFGRIGRFDYLTMVGKTGIAQISPNSPHLRGATGPLQGAKLLFGEGRRVQNYEDLMIVLGRSLGYNMQVMEDSICNWQKSPLVFRPFRG